MKNQTSRNLSRRSFLGTIGTTAAALTIVPNYVVSGLGHKPPSDMLNVACIGIANQGSGDIQQIATPDIPIKPFTPEQLGSLAKSARDYLSMVAQYMKSMPKQPGEPKIIKLANVYALCDVDSYYAANTFAGYPKAKIYSDWRQMLEKEKSIDAVVIATPDHNHAPIAAAFIKEKKHVYLEKPMAKTIYECRKLAELAKQYDVVTQMGNQGHSSEGTRKTVEWIQSGVIGDVREVNCFTSSPIWPQGNITRPLGVKVPKNLNWDVWLGPAPEKTFNPELCHFVWRGLWDYGTGAIGDLGAHILDAVAWSLNLGLPSKIQATSTPYSSDYMPQGESVVYEFPDRFTPGIGYMPAVKVTWNDGGLQPPRPETLEQGRPIGAATYIGDKGIIMHGSHGAMPELVPANTSFKGPDPWIPRTGNNFEDWINAIRNGKKSSNDFSWSSKVTEIMLLTDIAIQTKKSNKILEYDAANMKFTNLPEANSLFQYEYRKGWSL
jgi:predicted dehydrogenase